MYVGAVIKECLKKKIDNQKRSAMHYSVGDLNAGGEIEGKKAANFFSL